MISPRISVVVPTCNRNDALALCLDRLAPAAQTLPAADYEVIVTDDGAQNNARELIIQKYPWAKWTEGPQRGPAANRNHGARQSCGELVAFTDDDCLPTPHWLAAYASAIADEIEVYEGATAATGPLRAPFVIAPVNARGGVLWSCNMMVNRRLFIEMGGFDERFPHAADEDTDFRERVIKAGHALHFVPDALIYHPPVRRVWGRKTARLWESKVLLAYKANPARQRFTRREMLWNALRTRGRQLKRAPWNSDKLWGAAALSLELMWLARQTRSWDRKYRALFSADSSPEAADKPQPRSAPQS